MSLLQYGTTQQFSGGPIYLQSLGGGNLAVYDAAANGDGRLYSDIGGVVTQIGQTDYDAGDFKRLADGSFLLYRQSFDAGGATYEVLNPDGSLRVGQTDVADNTGRAITGPSATPLSNGGFLAAYTDNANAGNTNLVSFTPPANGSDANNVSESSDAGYRVYTPSGGGYQGSDFLTANTGTFDISDSAGTASGPDTAGQQLVEQTATLDNGTVVVPYLNQQYLPQGGGLTSANDVAVQLVPPGSVAGTSITVSQDPLPTNNSGLEAPAYAERGQGGVQVVADPGGFAVIWTAESFTPDSSVYGGYRQTGFDTNIRYFDDSGNALTNTVPLFHRDIAIGNEPLGVSADSLGDGRIALVYQDGVDGVNGTGSSLLDVDVIGALGSSQNITQITPGLVSGDEQHDYHLVSLGSGNIAVGYTDTNSGTVLQTFNVDGVAPPPPPPPPVPTVAFDLVTGGFVNGVTPILTGVLADPTGTAGVEIFNGDPANGGQDLGAATLNGDGTWTFSADLGPGDFNALTAVATNGAGGTGTAVAPYELLTGVTGAPYRAVEYDAGGDGSYGYVEYDRYGAPVSIAQSNGDGTHTTYANANGQTLSSISNDLMTGGGLRETFVFTPGFGQDEITDFLAAGPQHDTIVLSDTGFGSLAQVLAHTTAGPGGATIHLDPENSITLDGVSKALLRAHPNDIVLA